MLHIGQHAAEDNSDSDSEEYDVGPDGRYNSLVSICNGCDGYL